MLLFIDFDLDVMWIFVIGLINVWCCGNPFCKNIENSNEFGNIYFVGPLSLSQVVLTKRGRLKNVEFGTFLVHV